MKFNTIGIITTPRAESCRPTLIRLFEYMDKQDCKILLDDKTPDSVNYCHFEKAPRDVIGERCELIIVVGGDGTILNAVRSLSHTHVPIVGINAGRLGFLTDISPDHIESSLEEILQGSYREEERFLLEMKVYRNDELIYQADAFNDVVVNNRDVARMIEFETRINGEFVNHQRADGIVVSTPTGSTAYALAAGGPLLYATLEVITLVPIAPHTLSSRPIVVDSSSQVDILVCNTKEGIAQATCDGHLSVDVYVGDHIRVNRKPGSITMLHPTKHNYFEILRAKLHWSEYS